MYCSMFVCIASDRLAGSGVVAYCKMIAHVCTIILHNSYIFVQKIDTIGWEIFRILEIFATAICG